MQSLSDPLFVVPFLFTLCLGLLVVGGGLFIHQRYRDDVEDRVGRIAHGGAVIGGCSFGFGLVALALYYAGEMAELALLSGAPGSSLIGRVGLALPWLAVMKWFAVLFGAATVVASVAGAYDQYGDALR
ncbi:hypothetical protein BRD04_00990 [Halobacteriales archaeon QS_9_67_17]|nr:MAG: hypothetical protein BRD04_00990 [Halobacteriales archaeon QS_9_67_17]